MEVIEHVDRFGQVVTHRADVRLRHVGGHGDDLGAGATQALPQRLEGSDAFAVADEDDGAADQVEHHGQVAVSLADGDFIDGELLELVQLGLAEATFQRAGLDVLDGIPADLEVLGDILDGHEPRQVEDVAFEGTRVVLARVGEAELHLANLTAFEAQDARDLEPQLHRLGTDRHGLEGAFDAALIPDLDRAAVGAAMPFPRQFDAEGHPSPLEGLVDVTVANEAEGVVQ